MPLKTSAATRLRRSALDLALHSAARLAEWSPRVADRMARSRLIEDLAYAGPGSASRQRLDVFCPAGPGPHPIVFYIHGGGFTTCSRRTHRPIASIYASRGYLTFNVDYRLAPQHPFPAALTDVIAAYEWMVAHAAQYQGDLARIALAGESAGANLALALALAACAPRPEPFAARLLRCRAKPAAALLYCGLLQVTQPERYASGSFAGVTQSLVRDIGRAYLGRDAAQPSADAALADPLCVLEALAPGISLPPMFIAAGSADPLCKDSERLCAALRARGVPQVTKLYSGEHHAFHLMFWRRHALQCWNESFLFLDRYLASGAAPALNKA